MGIYLSTMKPWHMRLDAPKITPVCLWISSSLLGHEMRYDGDHKRDVFLIKEST
jgi:hypothetical protein